MTYQLTSLAQYRVMNGWGAFEYAGPTGTLSIITSADVLESYKSCMQAVSSLKLRTCDGGWTSYKDAASYFFDGRTLEMDLNAIYAQALYGMADNIVGKLFDLLGAQQILDALDSA